MEKSVFLKEEGNTPKNRIWSFLIVHSEYDYSMKDIARYSKVGYTTLKGLWKEFKEKNIVTQTRIVGKAKMYRLNLKNPVVNKFIDYYWAVVDSVVKRENCIKEESLNHSPSLDAVAVSVSHI
ncbi:MAG: hypothetical protein KKC75_07730 [Nanoarchaeota archaeon]|nr:hypothetical protein [Nanoarchaeota archaeon]MBU1005079.1 hypothetical protein [Nanoarchaeota archaeon]MBU1945364.1 hypothetical protein [Nanoarchaeota archaeon]